MYRDILANRTLLLKIQNEIVNNKRNAGLWKDYTEDTDGKNPLEMNMANIVRHIRDTLKRWENYGYQYFIREGKCKKD